MGVIDTSRTAVQLGYVVGVAHATTAFAVRAAACGTGHIGPRRGTACNRLKCCHTPKSAPPLSRPVALGLQRTDFRRACDQDTHVCQCGTAWVTVRASLRTVATVRSFPCRTGARSRVRPPAGPEQQLRCATWSLNLLPCTSRRREVPTPIDVHCLCVSLFACLCVSMSIYVAYVDEYMLAGPGTML